MTEHGPEQGDHVKVIAGKYEVRGVLGEGGSGVVYDAVRKSDGAAVALKVMHPHLAGEAQIRGRFQREAAILRRLEGPHVCPILDFGEVDSDEAGKTVLFIALPKIEGTSLEQVMRESGLLPVDRALDLLLQICAALKSAHAQGIIHRDLKPANVILEKGEKVVVVDFGLSKIVTGGGTGTTNLTAHNMLFGTPEYMSPEQARGDELDARCDVYAAGVILYEMLTGAPPFTGQTPLTVLTAHLTSDLEPPSRRTKDASRVTPALESAVMHALARDRDQRYASASALAAAIMHARVSPDDVASLRPEAFATSPKGTDAFAVTIPAAPPAALKGSAVIITDDATPISATLPSAPPAAPRRDASDKKAPSAPTSSQTAANVASTSEDAGSTRTWIILWVLAAIASIGVGVYFALR